MKVTFISTYLNHHQLPFCQEMEKIIGENFKYIATDKIPEERLNFGYEDMNSKYSFVIKSYENEEIVYKLSEESDVVIIGHAPKKYINKRLKLKKLTFKYSERVFKNGFKIRNLLGIYQKNGIINYKNMYLLCASAFAAYDYNKSNKYKNKTFKFGYFPEIIQYDINKIINQKEENSILWVGRFIKVKHPEFMINLANDLNKKGINFCIKMIGNGPLYKSIESQIKNNNLQDKIKLLGSMNSSSVREYMLKNKIFLYTADRGEGWGAVLNEAMNSGCAIIANSQIGSVPYLIEESINGLIFDSYFNLLNKTILLLKDNNLSKKIGKNAYNTVANTWNAKIAAERIIKISEALLKNEDPYIYKDGPCSKAEIIKDNWYNKKISTKY